MTAGHIDIRWSVDAQRGSARFDIGTGITCLMGRSGAGKTTLLRLLAGLLRPDNGAIIINNGQVYNSEGGVCLAPNQRAIGYVPQTPSLFPHLSVAQNISYGARTRNAADIKTPNALLETLAIAPLATKRPHMLSGGEAQRVAVARAITSNPSLLLLDEPTTGLDGRARADMIRLITALHRQSRIPILFTSHNPRDMLELADHAVLMADQKVIAEGSFESISGHTDARPLMGDLVSVNRITGHVAGNEGGLSIVEIDGQRLVVACSDLAVGQSVALRVPATDIALSLEPLRGTSIQNQLSCRITEIQPRENEALVSLTPDASDQTLRALITERSVKQLNLETGLRITALIKAIAIRNSA